ncbi:MAG: transposase [Hespellia sp.]|nr:transposase [Hespellia sp.]
MARSSRKESHTQLYHVMGRGNNEEKIFLKHGDKIKFIHFMEVMLEKAPVALYAYCIMDSHVHLIIRAELKDLSKYMHGLTGSYSLYFNGKNERAGHVFQDRYKSECIEKESYYWSCLRYVHNNPVQAGRVKEINNYPYSSVQEYLRKSSNLIHPLARKMLKSRFRTQREFFDFHKIIDYNIFLDIADEQRKRKYIVVKAQLKEFLEERQILLGEFLLNPKLRKEFIQEEHDKITISYKQIKDTLEVICLGIGFEENVSK